MNNWYRKRGKYPKSEKKVPQAQSISSLKSTITRNRNLLDEIKEKYGLVEPMFLEIEKENKVIEKNNKPLYDEWKEIELNLKKMSFKFLRKNTVEKYNVRISQIRNEIIDEKSRYDYDVFAFFQKKLGHFHNFEKFKKEFNYFASKCQSNLVVAEAEIERRVIGDSTISELESIKASFLNKSRELASKIKSQLKKLESCPYCGKSIGGNAEADHIYPVSKGGLSAPKNLVYVCNSCNSKKSSLTLNQFISKYKMDRNFIEGNLLKLNKEW